MEESIAVVEGLDTFYAAYSSHDPEVFAAALTSGSGVSVIGSAPGERHDNRTDWIATYAAQMSGSRVRLRGGESPRGWIDGSTGFVVDEARFVFPDGSFLPTRVTAVLSREGSVWKVVHLHFSVGVLDEVAIQSPTQHGSADPP
jgi:hypothetical protein